ncbi:hypothetical protein GWK47_011966 [Chionoecetes opilio]|uniref:Uncharacterized protein n=1 Tax=Chionoecetes opilio TaxID=41210 RepID=A0A8J4XWB8_CHIOP|nr:hypothetical protein GWK47_011966 [Chionoecetes opilio]
MSGSSSRKLLLEEKQGEFVREALPELLSLLAGHLQVEDTEKRKSSADRRSARELLGFMKTAGVLSVEVVRSLSFIIGATVQGEKQEHRQDALRVTEVVQAWQDKGRSPLRPGRYGRSG